MARENTGTLSEASSKRTSSPPSRLPVNATPPNNSSENTTSGRPDGEMAEHFVKQL